MRLSLHEQVKLMMKIDENGNWKKYEARMAFLLKVYRSATLNLEQYVYERDKSMRAFAGETL